MSEESKAPPVASTQPPAVTPPPSLPPPLPVIEATPKAEAKPEPRPEPAGKKDVPEMVPRYELQVRDAISDNGLQVTGPLRDQLMMLYVANGSPSDINGWLKGVSELFGLKKAGVAEPQRPAQAQTMTSIAAPGTSPTGALPQSMKGMPIEVWRGLTPEQKTDYWDRFTRAAGVGGDPRYSKYLNKSGRSPGKE